MKLLHPDWHGADAPDRRADAQRRLAEVNAAYAALAGATTTSPAATSPAAGATAAAPAANGPAAANGTSPGGDPDGGSGSFTVPAFRPMTFELLMVAAGDVGDVTDVDEPFSLVIHVEGPPTGFCRLQLFPEAGGSVVMADSDQVDPDSVCRTLVAALVRLGVDAVSQPAG